MRRTAAVLTSVIVSFVVHVAAIALVLKKPAHQETIIEIDPTPALAGETFEVPAENAPTAAPAGDQVPVTNEGTTLTPAPVRGASSTANSGAVAPPAMQYGAVGERGTTDVVVAFDRSLPQVMSADPEWMTIALGGAGSVDVTVAIDDQGSMFQADLGPGGSAALRRGVERTIAFIKGRTFTASAPLIHLRISAKVSPDAVHDGLHGDVFAIGASGEGHTAFFALSIGRRIDIEIKQLK